MGDANFTFILPHKDQKPAMIRMKLEGARPGVRAVALELLPGFTSYMATTNEKLRNKAIPHYGRVR